MKIQQIAKIKGGQDGAIYGSELFRFDHKGNCAVYDLSELTDGETRELSPIAAFRLDRADLVAPHSNAVCFGCEFYEAGDDYPLLYSNVYNNCKNEEDPMIGVCFVYRIQRTEAGFQSTLVQLIEIVFFEDPILWKASPDRHGVRPYGNFVIDRETRSYYAFVMRNEALGTRYFRFDLPSVRDGIMDVRFGVPKCVLGKADIRDSFDCSYHRYIQGAILHAGKIYSTEGFHEDTVNRPAIRIIDLKQKQETHVDIMDMGFVNEPEFIDFYGDTCLYSDAYGNLYTVEV